MIILKTDLKLIRNLFGKDFLVAKKLEMNYPKSKIQKKKLIEKI